MTVALHRSGRAGIPRLHQLFFPALVLAFGVVGWSHLYHAVVLGYADTPAGHTAHVLRDGLLAVPVALALAGGLWLTRRLPLVVQAAAVAAVLGLLLVPATGLRPDRRPPGRRRPAPPQRWRVGTRRPGSPGRVAERAGARRPPRPGRAGGRAAACAAGARAVGPSTPRPRARGRRVATGSRACLGEPACAHWCWLDRQRSRDSLRHATPPSVRLDR